MNMRVFIEINHPAHFHLFQNLSYSLIKNGNSVLLGIRDSLLIKDLVNKSDIPYVILGRKGRSIFSKVIKQIFFNWKVYKIIINNHIDICLGVSISIAQACLLTEAKSIVLDDDDRETTPVFALLSHSFANYVLCPTSIRRKSLKKKYIYHNSFHELAYLHPTIFFPDKTVVEKSGIDSNTNYSIVRFNSFNAHHDYGHSGLSIEQKQELISTLTKFGKVFVSCEDDHFDSKNGIPLSINPSEFHHVLAYANCYAGDSQTIASEAAVLGIPSFRCNTFKNKLSYLQELEDIYGLTKSYHPYEFERFLNDIILSLENPSSLIYHQEKLKIMLSKKINLTHFLIWFLSNWPDSPGILRESPDVQKQFV